MENEPYVLRLIHTMKRQEKRIVNKVKEVKKLFIYSFIYAIMPGIIHFTSFFELNTVKIDALLSVKNCSAIVIFLSC